MKRLLLLVGLLIPLSIAAQTSTEIKEYINYQSLDEVFELFKSKYGMKINYKIEDLVASSILVGATDHPYSIVRHKRMVQK